VAAFGINATRHRIVQAWSERVVWQTVVHPRACVHPSVPLGEGTVVFAGAVVQPGAVIGRHTIVNTAATVDHHSVVGDFVHLAPGVHLAGDVRVADGSFFGVGACAIPGTRIGEWTVVGAGAVVVRDVPARTTVVGVPARPLRPKP
jgi:sugar O-acyltransferase (sialic acid O-acetyltransferase NeuD family)